MEYHAHKESARALVRARLAYWAGIYPFRFGMVRIKNARRMWGSCSSKKNLNFNYRLVHLPEHLADYVILHELCHTVHLNHSRDFWGFMQQLMPDVHVRRVQLQQHTLAARILT